MNDAIYSLKTRIKERDEYIKELKEGKRLVEEQMVKCQSENE
jgi:hypothetical protein